TTKSEFLCSEQRFFSCGVRVNPSVFALRAARIRSQGQYSDKESRHSAAPLLPTAFCLLRSDSWVAGEARAAFMAQIACPLSFIVSGVTHTSALTNASQDSQF